MTILVGLILLVTVAGASSAMRNPERIGRVAALCVVGYLAAVLVWSIVSGDLLRRSGGDAATEEGCGQAKGC